MFALWDEPGLKDSFSAAGLVIGTVAMCKLGPDIIFRRVSARPERNKAQKSRAVIYRERKKSEEEREVGKQIRGPGAEAHGSVTCQHAAKFCAGFAYA